MTNDTDTALAPLRVAVARVEPGADAETLAKAKSAARAHVLAFGADAAPDDLAAVREFAAGWLAFAKELAEHVDAVFLERAVNDGAFEAGGKFWWAEHPKTTKCRNVPEAIKAIERKTEGDYDAVMSCLSANALKAGACRAVLGDEFSKHFAEERRAKLESGEELPKRLASGDTRFLKSRP